MALPHFFVAGAPKAGTTAIHVALSRHPDIGMSRIKEPKFFLCDGHPPRPSPGPGDHWILGGYVWQRDAYEALFDELPGRSIRGESSALYLQDPEALTRIHRLVPDARFVVVLRQPEERAHSNWAHLWSLGRESIPDFLAACDAEERRRKAGWEPFWYYKSLGRYGEQVQFLLSLFPYKNLKVILYEDFKRDPLAVVADVCRFLGVAEDALGHDAVADRENVTQYVEPTPVNRALSTLLGRPRFTRPVLPKRLRYPVRRFVTDQLRRRATARPAATAEQQRALRAWYEDDIRLLTSLVPLDVSAWAIDDPSTAAP